MFATSLVRQCLGTIVTILLASVHGLSAAETAGGRVHDFYAELVAKHEVSLPSYSELLRIQEEIGKVSKEEMTRALPLIINAVRHPAENVQVYAAAGLYATSLRHDSAQLLADHLEDVAALLAHPAGRLQAAGVTILAQLKPRPPHGAFSLLLDFLTQPGRDVKAQGGAVFELVRLAPDAPEVIDAVKAHLSRPLNAQDRVAALNAIGSAAVRDASIVSLVITDLEHPDGSVRYTALQVLRRLGKNALLLAEPSLRQLAEDSEQPAEVREMAKEALADLRSSNEKP